MCVTAPAGRTGTPSLLAGVLAAALSVSRARAHSSLGAALRRFWPTRCRRQGCRRPCRRRCTAQITAVVSLLECAPGEQRRSGRCPNAHQLVLVRAASTIGVPGSSPLRSGSPARDGVAAGLASAPRAVPPRATETTIAPSFTAGLPSPPEPPDYRPPVNTCQGPGTPRASGRCPKRTSCWGGVIRLASSSGPSVRTALGVRLALAPPSSG